MDAFFQTYFDFQIIDENFGYVLEGFWWTIRLSLLGGALSLLWGLILAVLRQLPGRALAPVRWLTVAYIDALRGIPLLLVIFLIYGGLGALASEGVIPRDLGIPRWFGLPSPFWYGIIAITLTYGAYMAEVYRAGIEAVPSGQTEAARSLGAGRGKVFLRVLLPLSMPGIQSGCVLVFILSCGAYVTPALLGAGRVHTITTEVITLLDQFLWPFGAALALLLSLVGLIAVALFAWGAGRMMRGIS